MSRLTATLSCLSAVLVFGSILGITWIDSPYPITLKLLMTGLLGLIISAVVYLIRDLK